MEVLLHGMHVVAIKDAKAWVGMTPFQISMVGYFNLKVIWLKLLIIWRFFRLWALSDTIDSTENMTRCMSNNFSAMDFWKHWHRSFNRWLVRYLYIPLGGSTHYALTIWPIFTFVAVWHDVSMRLLMWGWLVPAFILPEVVVKRVFGGDKGRKMFGKMYRHLAAIAAVFNILLMMVANLVGFAVGVDGVKEMGAGILDREGGAMFIIATLVGLFCGVQVMFEWREMENRRKVAAK
ncbi:glycerol transporter [Borealophlyctis nickersoniae]|nr:glycerol transporter [Borealophlyctis nickersoniae]